MRTPMKIFHLSPQSDSLCRGLITWPGVQLHYIKADFLAENLYGNEMVVKANILPEGRTRHRIFKTVLPPGREEESCEYHQGKEPTLKWRLSSMHRWT